MTSEVAVHAHSAGAPIFAVEIPPAASLISEEPSTVTWHFADEGVVDVFSDVEVQAIVAAAEPAMRNLTRVPARYFGAAAT